METNQRSNIMLYVVNAHYWEPKKDIIGEKDLGYIDELVTQRNILGVYKYDSEIVDS